MTRRSEAATKPKANRDSPKVSKVPKDTKDTRSTDILSSIRLKFGSNHVKYGNNPPKPEQVLIPIGQLCIENLYQRTLKPIARKIATNFDINSFGIPLVALREDGKYWVIDGQQRIAGVTLVNKAIPGYMTSVWCELIPWFEGEVEEAKVYEAKVFTGRNNSQRLQPCESFKAEWVSKDAKAMSIMRNLNQKGVTVKGIPFGDSVEVACIAAVKFAHNVGSLNATIDVIKATWGLIDEAFKVTCFHPIAVVIYKNNGGFDFVRLVDVLKKFTPRGLEAAANTTAGHKRTVNIANRIIKAYNKSSGIGRSLTEVNSADIA